MYPDRRIGTRGAVGAVTRTVDPLVVTGISSHYFFLGVRQLNYRRHSDANLASRRPLRPSSKWGALK